MGEHFEAIRVIVCTTALFGAIILCLAAPPKMTKRVIAVIATLTAIGALGIYGYGYALNEAYVFPINAIRATFAVCRVFVGTNYWSDVEGAFGDSVFWQIVFWLVHLMGFFTTASAAITRLGASLLRKLRLMVLYRRNVALIYGLNKNTLDFARELTGKKNVSVLFVDSNAGNSLSAEVDRMGAILRTDPDAVKGTVRFLRSIGMGPGRRKIWVYALQPDMLSGQRYARNLMESMQQRGIDPEQTSLTVLGPGDETDSRFLAQSGHYGYGSVISVSEPELVARMLVHRYPPCDRIVFDKNGRAKNDFHGLIIGFGQVGQAVLQQLTMNGQFAGSRFRLAVFDGEYARTMGRLAHECGSMLDHYDISFHPYDGRSCQVYDYIAENAGSLNYIVICTGQNKINQEIEEELLSFLKRKNCSAPVYLCSRLGVYHREGEDQIVTHSVYTEDVLCSGKMDARAMVLNQYYAGSGNMRENWNRCGYFNRMSSRAAADFHRAILRAAGVTEEAAKKHWAPEGELLENLAETEHLRWNAFHYCMGFRPMTEKEFSARAEIYRAEKARNPQTGYRITRDMDLRTHACLIPWEELDAFSAKENAITGGNRDYKENDRINIRALADVLRAMEDA